MPRRPRIKLSGLPQHIVQRGVNREPCFFAEEDYGCYLHWLKTAATDYHCAIHAYVLMTNHVHLLVTPDEPDGLSRMMQSVGRRYVQYVNRIYKRTGTLWEGRFKSSVVQEAHYFLVCCRYIELNPVRAGMVTDPGQYRWSSYRHNGLGLPDERLTRQQAGMVDVGVGKQDEIDLLGIEAGKVPVEFVRHSPPLEHAAIHKETQLAGFNQEAGTSDLAGGAREGEVHDGLRIGEEFLPGWAGRQGLTRPPP